MHHTHTHTCLSLLTTHHRKDFNGDDFNGKITKRIFEGLSSDAKPLYHVLYDDGNAEDLYTEEIVPLLVVRAAQTTHTPALTLTFVRFLQDPERKRELVNAMNDIEKLMNEMKKDSGDRNEFLMSFDDRSENFLTSLWKKGEILAVVSIIIVFLVITSVNVNATKVLVRGKRPQNANHVFYFHHDKSCCKCDRIAMTKGQDESVFHAYILGR